MDNSVPTHCNPAPAAPEPTARELVAAAIVAWRTAAGLSRQQVAARLDVSDSMLSRWETAVAGRTPNADRLLAFAEVCGVGDEERQRVTDLALVARRADALAPVALDHLRVAL